MNIPGITKNKNKKPSRREKWKTYVRLVTRVQSDGRETTILTAVCEDIRLKSDCNTHDTSPEGKTNKKQKSHTHFSRIISAGLDTIARRHVRRLLSSTMPCPSNMATTACRGVTYIFGCEVRGELHLISAMHSTDLHPPAWIAARVLPKPKHLKEPGKIHGCQENDFVRFRFLLLSIDHRFRVALTRVNQQQSAKASS